MGDYQIRGWNGFHNHMAISMMAMLLIIKVKVQNKNQNYTAATIRKVTNLCIKTKIENPSQAINIIFQQHYRYQKQLEIDKQRYGET